MADEQTDDAKFDRVMLMLEGVATANDAMMRPLAAGEVRALVEGVAELTQRTTPTLGQLLLRLQEVPELMGDYPHVYAHPRHAARLQHEGTFDGLAPVVAAAEMHIGTLVVVRTSPVSIQKTRAFEDKVAANKRMLALTGPLDEFHQEGI